MKERFRKPENLDLIKLILISLPFNTDRGQIDDRG